MTNNQPVIPEHSNIRIKKTIIFILAFILIGVSCLYFSFSIGKPIMGIDLEFINGSWTVSSEDPNGIAPRAGIKIGDVAVSVNGQPADEYLSEEEVIYGRNIQQIEITDSTGSLQSISLQDYTQPWQNKLEIIILFLTCVIFWATGLFVFAKIPHKQPATLLLLTSLVFGLTVCANMALERYASIAASQIGAIGAIIGPWLLFHFFLVLPEERTGIRNNHLTYLIYLPAVVLSLLFVLIGFENGQAIPSFRTVRLIAIVLGFLAVLTVVIFNFRRAVSPRTRQQMKIIAISCLIAVVPFLIIYLIPHMIFHQVFIPAGYLLFFLSFIPAGMGYAVITQKLLDIDIFIRRGIIYGLISIIMALILAAGIVTVMLLQSSLTLWEDMMIALLLGIIATVLFGPIKLVIERLVDRLFYKERYDYRIIIQGFSSSLNQLQEVNEISRLIVATIVRNLNLSGALIILRNQLDAFDVALSDGTLSDPDIHVRLLKMVYNRESNYEFPNRFGQNDPVVSYFIPIKVMNKELGFLCLSYKKYHEHFTPDDLYLIQGIVNVAANTLRSAMLNRDVSLRDTFVSIASHELRTPLTAIIGYADLLLRKEPSTDTRKQWLSNILENGNRISEMVDDLLNVTRIQSGKLNLKLDKVNLSEVIETLLPIYQERTNKHSFIVDLAENIPPVYSDRDKLSQIIGNLVSNAVKYSPHGGRVIIKAVFDNSQNKVVLSVQDEGIGISQADIATLFKTFHRIQRPETIAIRGSGLGLYIVKQWIEAMGGKVWLDSELNKGSIFYIEIPVN